MIALNFLCGQHMQIYHVNQLQAFQLLYSSLFQVKVVNHCKSHLSFQDIDHQLQENILYTFFIITFYKTYNKFTNIFHQFKVIYKQLS